MALAVVLLGSGCHARDITGSPFLLRDAGALDDRESSSAASEATDQDASTQNDVQARESAALPKEEKVVASSAYPRLSHRQWAHAAQDLLRLDALPDVSKFSADPATGTGFDNTSDKLEVAQDLWTDYQSMSEALASEVAASPEKLQKLLPDDLPDAGEPRARAFIAQLAERAFRRPLRASEQDEYYALFQQGAQLFPERAEFSSGAELIIAALLQSPALIYQIENTNSPAADGVAALSDVELASRLSFMLWDAPPDEQLLREAKAQRLHTPDQIAAQVERMLQSARANDKLLEFHRQWLELRRYDAMHVEGLPERIGVTLREEAEAFVRAAVLDEAGSFAALFKSSFGFVNRDLAKLYGVHGDFGDKLERTQLDPAQRVGLFTRLGFLISTAGETAPIRRGVFINRKLLCANLPPPPMFTPSTMVGETRRERIDSITGQGTCGAGCHAVLINPAGFPLEYFDDLGRYRNDENGHAVDGSATYPFSDGPKSYSDPVEFSSLFVASRQAHDCYARQLLEFSLGRALADDDDALIERVSAATQDDAMPVRKLVSLLTRGVSFRNRRSEAQ